jgi:hypothetical protein
MTSWRLRVQRAAIIAKNVQGERLVDLFKRGREVMPQTTQELPPEERIKKLEDQLDQLLAERGAAAPDTTAQTPEVQEMVRKAEEAASKVAKPWGQGHSENRYKKKEDESKKG